MARVVHRARRSATEYLPEKPNFYASRNKSAQEAHEAIRPTDVDLHARGRARRSSAPTSASSTSSIWNRFVACQMPPAEFDQTTVTIAAPTKEGDAVFRATGRKLVFDGFMKVAGVSSEDQLLPELAGDSSRSARSRSSPTQHFTQPPPRFTEASLVKELEQLGIGRPSHVREHHPDDPGPRVRRSRGPPLLRDDARLDRHRQADPGVPRDHGRRASPPAWS